MPRKSQDELNHGRSARKGMPVRQRETEPADWATADPALVLELVTLVGLVGGAIRFGYTSDGGAYAIGFYNGDERKTEYVRPNEDINTALREFIELWR